MQIMRLRVVSWSASLHFGNLLIDIAVMPQVAHAHVTPDDETSSISNDILRSDFIPSHFVYSRTVKVPDELHAVRDCYLLI